MNGAVRHERERFKTVLRSTTERLNERRLDVQGLRALAVIIVVAYHAGLPVPGGFVGVDVFFVISGFVITAMLRREWQSTGQIHFKQFYIRRFKRLMPALALVVTTTVVVGALVLSPLGAQQTAAKTAIGAMLFAANFAIANTSGGYFDAPAATNPLLNTWSLSVEEQFYLAFPVLLAGSWFLGRKTPFPRLVPLMVVAIVAAISFGLAVRGSVSSAEPESTWLIGFYSPFTRAWEFSAGALLALTEPRVRATTAAVASSLGFTGLALLLASICLITDKTPFPSSWTLLPVAGTMLLIQAGTHGSNPVTKGLTGRAIVSIGDWSYSIYLWHWPLIVFAGTVWPDHAPWLLSSAVALSLVLALGSYYWVEQPIRTMPSVSRAQLTRLVAATLAIPLFVSLGLGIAARTMFWDEALRQDMAAVRSDPTGFHSPPCMSRVPISRRDIKPCQWHVGARGSPIYLIGDSNAIHFSDALILAGAEMQRPVTVLGGGGCPLIDVYLRRSTDPSLLQQCRDDYLALMNWLRNQPQGTVMISSVDRYWHDSDYLASQTEDFAEAAGTRNPLVLNAGLAKTVGELRLAGHAVTLIQTIPHFTSKPHTLQRAACSGWEVLVGACRVPTITMPVAVADEQQRAARNGIRSVAAATGARILDLRSFFCPNGICSTQHNDGTHLYTLDGYHLNKGGSELLKDEFVSELSGASK